MTEPSWTWTRRIIRTFVQTIHAPPDRVFPLLCPEREKEWLPGWDARMLYSASGVAERGAVFETRNDTGRTLAPDRGFRGAGATPGAARRAGRRNGPSGSPHS